MTGASSPDVLIIGDGIAGCTAAITAREAGASVLVIDTTPDVPEDRIAALRTAFISMTKTKEFLQEVEKQNIEMSPMDGAHLQKVVNATFDISPATIAKLREFRTD